MKWSSYNAPFFLFFFFLFYGKNMEHHTWKIKGCIKRIWVATCTGGSTDTLLRLHSSRQAQTDFWWRARTIVKARNTSGCTFMEQHIPWWISSYNTHNWKNGATRNRLKEITRFSLGSRTIKTRGHHTP